MQQPYIGALQNFIEVVHLHIGFQINAFFAGQGSVQRCGKAVDQAVLRFAGCPALFVAADLLLNPLVILNGGIEPFILQLQLALLRQQLFMLLLQLLFINIRQQLILLGKLLFQLLQLSFGTCHLLPHALRRSLRLLIGNLLLLQRSRQLAILLHLFLQKAHLQAQSRNFTVNILQLCLCSFGNQLQIITGKQLHPLACQQGFVQLQMFLQSFAFTDKAISSFLRGLSFSACLFNIIFGRCVLRQLHRLWMLAGTANRAGLAGLQLIVRQEACLRTQKSVKASVAQLIKMIKLIAGLLILLTFLQQCNLLPLVTLLHIL